MNLPKEGILLDADGFPITGVILSDQIKSLDFTARNLKVLKKYDATDLQGEEIRAIVEECLAKIRTYLN